MMRKFVWLSALALSACGAPVAEIVTSVRHVASTEPYGDNARMHIFLFDPDAPRSFDDRKAIARRAIRLEPGCAWVDAPDNVLKDAIAKQGARFEDRVFVAPLKCSRT